MEIREITEMNTELASALGKLMQELGSTANCDEKTFRAAVESQDTHLYVGTVDGSAICTATLCVAQTPERRLGFVESVVVSEDRRGKGLGRELMTHILKESERLRVEELHLTSKPSRKAANKLYQSLGFTLKETNCYTLKLD